MSQFIKFYFSSSMLNSVKNQHPLLAINHLYCCILLVFFPHALLTMHGYRNIKYAQHVSDINTSIIRSLRLFYCITTLVVCSCFDVCWSFGVAGLGWYPCCRLKPATKCQDSLAHEDNKVVSPTHWQPLLPRKYSWYLFLTEAESIPGP